MKHGCGATLSDLESEAEPLYETLDEHVGYVEGKINSKPHSL